MGYRDVDAKRVYYLSMEFLMGRSLLNALNNLGVVDQVRCACPAAAALPLHAWSTPGHRQAS